MNEEQLKKHLLDNFCDGDSWNDAKADRFTHEGALEIAKYFYTAGLSRLKEMDSEMVDIIKDIQSYSPDGEIGTLCEHALYNLSCRSQASSAIKEEINKSKV